MVVLEMAIAESRKKSISQKSKSSAIYTERASLEDPLNWGNIGEAVYYLTGKYPKCGNNEKSIAYWLTQKSNTSDDIAMVAGFKGKDEAVNKGIIKNHFYSVKRVMEDTVYVVNPWDSSKEIPYPKDKFIQNCSVVSITNIKSKST